LTATTRVIRGYNPVVNGHSGYGTWTSVITASLQAGVAISTMLYQDKLRRDAEKKAEHEAARQRQHELDMQAAAAAQHAAAVKAAEAQAAITAGATGGAVAVTPSGQPIPASGVVPGRMMMPAGGGNMLMVGVLGVAAIGVIMLIGKRR
jgi:hypothetical protein